MFKAIGNVNSSLMYDLLIRTLEKVIAKKKKKKIIKQQ